MNINLKVNSSAINKVSYNSETKEMKIRFKSGPTFYSFYNVPTSIVCGLVKAESVGKYYHKHIRGRYVLEEA